MSHDVYHLTKFVYELQWCRPVRKAHLKAFSQCSWQRSGVMWLTMEDKKMSQAAALINDWSHDRRYDGMPASVVLPQSSHEMTRDDTNHWIMALVSHLSMDAPQTYGVIKHDDTVFATWHLIEASLSLSWIIRRSRMSVAGEIQSEPTGSGSCSS